MPLPAGARRRLVHHVEVPTALLILPTGTYRAEEYLAAARRLGLEVVTASERAQALAGRMGDRFLEVPIEDPAAAAEAIVAHAGRVHLDAVVAVDDQGLLAAALAAARLGLRHSPVGAVRLTRDKAGMRRAFEAAGVPQPDFVIVEPGSPAGAAEAASLLGPPVVVKACSLSGSRGVIRADSPPEAARAAERVRAILEDEGELPRAPLLVERFVAGPEVALEGVLSGGELDVVAIFDKPEPLEGPYFEETIYVAPTALDDESAGAVERAARRAVAALGLTDGPVHAELRVPGGGEAKVLELAARTIGGRCSKALALPGGASLEELILARALGLAGPEPRLAGPAGVLMIPIPRTGVLRRVHHLEEVRHLRHVTGVEVTVPEGRVVRALPEGDRYLGFVFAAAPERALVEAALRAARDAIEVEIDEAAPGGVAILPR